MGFELSGLEIGNDKPFVFIGGPCVVEGEEFLIRHARTIKGICGDVGCGYILKSSYDKANRSSHSTFRGVGMEEGLKILKETAQEVGVPVLTDVHTPQDVEQVAEAVDVIQIPAFLCRQTDLLLEAGRTGKAINVKKGQFLSPYEVKNVVEKVYSTGNSRVIVTERGFSFGYQNLVVDYRSLEIIKDFGVPVCFDGTHSVQLPGGAGASSSGERRFVFPLSRAAVAVGIAALFWEVHENPNDAPSDGPNMIPLSKLKEKLVFLKQIDDLTKRINIKTSASS